MQLAVIGGGPAGLMAAEVAAKAGLTVAIFEAMPDCGRKLLVAGQSGLNLTYALDHEAACARYGARASWIAAFLAAWSAEDTRAWADGLGVTSFVGTSGRVFPEAMKAAELRKRILDRLRTLGVSIHTRHRWQGWTEQGALGFDTPEGVCSHQAEAAVLALGGASWPETGSDGSWAHLLAARGVTMQPFVAANCGFDCDWSPAMQRFAGSPLKNVALRCGDAVSCGECVITATGIEGQALYALGAAPREALAADGHALLQVDLKRDLDHASIVTRLRTERGKRSLSDHLRRRLGLRGPSYSLLRECDPGIDWADAEALASFIKAVPVRLLRSRPIAEAISTAGGVAIEACEGLMLRAAPGVFVCGEMLDWDAPTGGFLLQACFSTGHAAGTQAHAWITRGATPCATPRTS